MIHEYLVKIQVYKKNDYITTPSERSSTNFEFMADLLHSLFTLFSAYVKKIIEISNLVGRGYEFYCSSGFLRRPQKYEEICQLK